MDMLFIWGKINISIKIGREQRMPAVLVICWAPRMPFILTQEFVHYCHFYRCWALANICTH